MLPTDRIPIALTIAGSDSGGGAGIQADLKTFAALGVHGTTAISCVTAQNPRGVNAVQPLRTAIVAAQLEAVLTELPPAAIKTGMLFSAQIVRTVAERLKMVRVPVVVDPVMVATSGKLLLKPGGLAALRKYLLPAASLVTPNCDEARILSGMEIPDEEASRQAARVIYDRFGCAVLVKGGHLRGADRAVDILYDGRDEWMISAPFVKGLTTHGTGCTYSAAITGFLARGLGLVQAVEQAKQFITEAIALSKMASGHPVLNWARE
jgi:hydroxymethylpyrimidine/phosphomethylpyrimidine kinase